MARIAGHLISISFVPSIITPVPTPVVVASLHDEFVTALPELTVTTPIPIMTIAVTNANASTTGTNAKFNTLR
jgi:tetrahydromethanopterin S-methyltransferase subunit C